jgi:hypothetical protein
MSTDEDMVITVLETDGKRSISKMKFVGMQERYGKQDV